MRLDWHLVEFVSQDTKLMHDKEKLNDPSKILLGSFSYLQLEYLVIVHTLGCAETGFQRIGG